MPKLSRDWRDQHLRKRSQFVTFYFLCALMQHGVSDAKFSVALEEHHLV